MPELSHAQRVLGEFLQYLRNNHQGVSSEQRRLGYERKARRPHDDCGAPCRGH